VGSVGLEADAGLVVPDIQAIVVSGRPTNPEGRRSGGPGVFDNQDQENLRVPASSSTLDEVQGKREQQSNLEDLPRKLSWLCFFAPSH